MIYPYKTDELTIAGDKRKYSVFENLHGQDGSILVGEKVFDGSLAQCKAFVEGYLFAETDPPQPSL